MLRIYQGSISSTVYTQLSKAQVSKAPNNNADLNVFFALSGSAGAKAAARTLMKLSPGL